MSSKLRVDFYRTLYRTKDPVLIAKFWKFYNTHKFSKNKAARCVLISYYSTTPVPYFVYRALSLKHDIKVAKFNLWSDVL